MITTEPWHIDPSVHHTLQNSPQKTSTYTLVAGGPTDYQKVATLYQKSPVAGYHVGRVEIIYNPAFARGFEGTVMTLNARAHKPAFAPKWNAEQDQPIRTRIDQALKTITIEHPCSHQSVQLFPAFHGTKAPLLARQKDQRDPPPHPHSCHDRWCPPHTQQTWRAHPEPQARSQNNV